MNSKVSRKNQCFIIGMLVVLVAIICLLAFSTREPEHVNVQAKLAEYTTVEEVENTADIIAVCEKKSEDAPTVMKNSEGDITAVFTLSLLEVKSVEKGNVVEGDMLTVLENEGYVEETNTVYHIAGYKKMKQGNQYLLFLRSADGNPWFIPVGVNIGKIPLDNDEEILAEQCNKPEIVTETKGMHKLIRVAYEQK